MNTNKSWYSSKTVQKESLEIYTLFERAFELQNPGNVDRIVFLVEEISKPKYGINNTSEKFNVGTVGGTYYSRSKTASNGGNPNKIQSINRDFFYRLNKFVNDETNKSSVQTESPENSGKENSLPNSGWFRLKTFYSTLQRKYFVITLIAICAFGLFKIYHSSDSKATYAAQYERYPIKIIVLPFEKDCEYQGETLNIGQMICRRLTMLNAQDTLNIEPAYFNQKYSNISQDRADSILLATEGDLLVWGAYSLKQCEGGVSDKVCFNYSLKKNDYELVSKNSNFNNRMIAIPNLDTVRSGAGQEEIDNILYLLGAFAAKQNGEFRKTIRLLTKITDYQTDKKVLALLGFFYCMGDISISKAIDCYKKTLKLDSNQYTCWVGMGYCYGQLNAMDSAVPYFKKVLPCITKNKAARRVILQFLGTGYEKLKNYSEAQHCYEEALSINNKIDSLWFALGCAFAHQSKYSKAEDAFKKALTINPHHKEALYNLACEYFNSEDYLNAKKIFEEFIGLYPNHGGAWASLGMVNTHLKNFAEAEKDYCQILKVDPANGMSGYNYGLACLQSFRHNRTEALVSCQVKDVC